MLQIRVQSDPSKCESGFIATVEWEKIKKLRINKYLFEDVTKYIKRRKKKLQREKIATKKQKQKKCSRGMHPPPTPRR